METQQQEIICALGVTQSFDVSQEIERRINFLADYLEASGQHAYVLGISGGVDSTVAGRLTQLAVEKLRKKGRQAMFHAVRLPYLKQQDEQDAQAALSFIRADKNSTVNIHSTVDALRNALGDDHYRDAHHEDFVVGNMKARARMIVQYAIAGAEGGLVVGTDHAAEALMGFFTKFGDGAADVIPLSGLNKRRVRSLGQSLGAPSQLVAKRPTADLESLSPQKADEDVFGISYDVIDDFLEGKEIDCAAYEKIVRTYAQTQHKRELPVSPGTVRD